MSYPRSTLYLAVLAETTSAGPLYLAIDPDTRLFRLNHRDAYNVLWFVDDADALAHILRVPSLSDEMEIEAAIEPWRPTGMLVSSGLIVHGFGGSQRAASELLRYE